MTKSNPKSKLKPEVELTPYLIEAISCYVTFIAMGYDPKCMQTLVSKNKIAFLFTFDDDERYIFTAVELPSESVARDVSKSWRPALEHWNTLSKPETNLMIVTSKAFDTVPPFLEFLSLKGHLPALGHDGSPNNEFAVPCPYCQSILLCKYDPLMPVIAHPTPPCLDFLQSGGDGVMEELNRRGKYHMEGGIGESPKHRPEPS
jgi:hypothetical protein